MRQNPIKKNVIYRMITENKSNHPLLMFTLISIVLFSAGRLFMSFYLGGIIDTAMTKGIASTFKEFGILMLGIVCYTLIFWLYVYLFGIYGQRTLHYLRGRIIKSVIGIPLPSMANYSTGDLISRINNDLALIEEALNETVPYTLNTLLMGLFGTILALVINWKMAIFAVVIPIFVSAVTWILLKPIQQKQEEIQKVNAQITELSQNAVGGYVEIKAFHLYSSILSRLKALTDQVVQKTYEIIKIESTLITIIDCAGIALQIGIVFVGLYFVMNGEITMGQMVVFQQIQEIMRQMFKIRFSDILKASAGTKRIYELLDEEQELLEGEVQTGREDESVIAFHDVHFSYMENEVLHGISFEVHPRESIALVGASGCGKSTVLKLICGLLEPESGEICYKGYETKKWDKRKLRHEIALVDQNTYLFPSSIYDNIACGLYEKSDAGEEMGMIKKSAVAAGIHGFITSLEKGYDSDVGEWGSKLSGGQKQRISIARAFVKDSELLILDEPTSALDAESELEVQRSIEKLMEGRTTILVAHRLSTIKNVDRILVLDKGRIAEEGSHSSLLQKRGIYYKLYQKQFRLEKEGAYEEGEHASNY